MSFLSPLRPFEETGLARPSARLEDVMRDMWAPPVLAPSRSPRVVNVVEKVDAYELE